MGSRTVSLHSTQEEQAQLIRFIRAQDEEKHVQDTQGSSEDWVCHQQGRAASITPAPFSPESPGKQQGDSGSCALSQRPPVASHKAMARVLLGLIVKKKKKRGIVTKKRILRNPQLPH